MDLTFCSFYDFTLPQYMVITSRFQDRLMSELICTYYYYALTLIFKHTYICMNMDAKKGNT